MTTRHTLSPEGIDLREPTHTVTPGSGVKA